MQRPTTTALPPPPGPPPPGPPPRFVPLPPPPPPPPLPPPPPVSQPSSMPLPPPGATGAMMPTAVAVTRTLPIGRPLPSSFVYARATPPLPTGAVPGLVNGGHAALVPPPALAATAMWGVPPPPPTAVAAVATGPALLHALVVPAPMATEPAHVALNRRPSITNYEKLAEVGEGTYGIVHKARNTQTNELVALKCIKVENSSEGFPLAAMREIKALRRVQHENILRILEVVHDPSQDMVCIVLEFMEHDLSGLLTRETIDETADRLEEAVVKNLMLQLLRGLECLHAMNIVHRDIKASNLLINNRGQLKLADFGLARVLGGPSLPTYENRVLTNRVITLGYRPPELLLGNTIYGTEVDIWSTGCIMAEMFIGKTFFRGDDEITQAHLVFSKCGTPSSEGWPGVEDLPWYSILCSGQRHPRVLYDELCKQHFLSDEAAKLIDRMLTLNPSKRITASEALIAGYFTEYPPPAPMESMPRFEREHRQRAVRPYVAAPSDGGSGAIAALASSASIIAQSNNASKRRRQSSNKEL